jgi:hypothetical protein
MLEDRAEVVLDWVRAKIYLSDSFLIVLPVMRKDAVYTLLLNITLFPGMVAALADQDSRYLRFSAIENGVTTHYNLRVRRVLLLVIISLIAFSAGKFQGGPGPVS